MNKKNSSYKISWPILQKKRDLNKSNRAKFIELLLWYSKIKNIIDNIRTNNRKNFNIYYNYKIIKK